MRARKTKARKLTATPAAKPQQTIPPFDLTDAEVSEILASHRMTAGSLETETDKCGSVLDDIAYEVKGLAEAITHAINDVSHDNATDARLMADALMSFARSLGDVSARMMRYAGRLEAYRDAEDHAVGAEKMVRAYRDGTLGRPKPEIRDRVRGASCARSRGAVVNAASLRDDVIALLEEAEDHVIGTVTCNDNRDARADAMSALINIRMARGTLQDELDQPEIASKQIRDPEVLAAVAKQLGLESDESNAGDVVEEPVDIRGMASALASKARPQ